MPNIDVDDTSDKDLSGNEKEDEKMKVFLEENKNQGQK